jgi:magnesium chelatase family protein
VKEGFFLQKIQSCCIEGLEVYPINVEVDMDTGLPMVMIVGLPNAAVKESKDRVRSALKNNGFDFPLRRITINLSPAYTRKNGTHLDLPIALGLLGASGQIPPLDAINTLCLGELSLDGKINGVRGVLPMLLEMRKLGYRRALIPADNQEEGRYIEGMEVLGFDSLTNLLHFLEKGVLPEEISLPEEKNAEKNLKTGPANPLDFRDLKGQEGLKRGIEIAASGAHNILFIGPPGSGKSMAAKRIPSILPPLSYEEALQVTTLYSISGKLDAPGGLITKRPFRSPHSSSTAASLSGGGLIPMPGEISLAHHGILFLDELPEFDKGALEILRQPMEDREITLSRSHRSFTYPSNFLFAAAMNPCPCGFYGDPVKSCSCSAREIQRYHHKISGPLLDRIDIIVEVPRGEYKHLNSTAPSVDSKTLAKRVLGARKIQQARYKDHAFNTNGRLPDHLQHPLFALSDEGEELLAQAYDKFQLTARGYHKVLKVSRTIADLEGSLEIKARHILEALQYRQSHLLSP